jgi:hypothetical protein
VVEWSDGWKRSVSGVSERRKKNAPVKGNSSVQRRLVSGQARSKAQGLVKAGAERDCESAPYVCACQAVWWLWSVESGGR